MSGLHLHTSNRLEVLATRLARELGVPLASPFTPEVIVVQSQGMARWLKLQLAAISGIWANGRFPFPDDFAQEIFARITGAPQPPRFTREVLEWRLLELLPALAPQPGFEAVRHYLADGDARKQHQLARRVADLFLRYSIHRPALVLGWEASRDGGWQAELWRALTAGFEGAHPAALQRQCLALATIPAGVLPGRVCVFGIASLPRFHLDFLSWLGARCEVHLFRLEPSWEFWSDIRSTAEQRRALRRAGQSGDAAAGFHYEAGNRLLASLGRAGRAFQEQILESADWQEHDEFLPPGHDSLLHALQDDILCLRERGKDEDAPPLAIGPEDDSLRVHSCHSPLREVEVLYDQLLDCFNRNATLQPRDILVLTPDIETYAPAIQAVFDAPEEGRLRIPYSLADRTARRAGRVVATFLRVLALPETRLTAVEVLAPLETPAVRERFGLAESDLPLCRGWIEEVNIRWGRDAAHLASLDLPEHDENTWRHGLDRLLLGHAMAPGHEEIVAGVLPFDGIEGGAAETLGCLVEFVETLFEIIELLQRPRSVTAWQAVLLQVLDRCFAGDAAAVEETGLIRRALAGMQQQAAFASFAGEVPRTIIQEVLQQELEAESFSSGFLTGGVTFGALKPMRSIPCRVLCLLGLNDGVFPRQDARMAFDLMAAKPERGDPSRRQDDRYLFLEALLSARDRLHLSYVGQSQQDNASLPPSVVISELLDSIRQGFHLAPGEGNKSPADAAQALRDRLVVKHKLHPFSAAYFDGRDPNLFSYSAQNLTASRAAAGGRLPLPAFVAKLLPEPDPEFRNVSLDDLVRFFHNPSKVFCSRRLGLRFPGEEAALADTEPFEINTLEAYALQSELVERELSGAALDDTCRNMLRAAGRVPHGVAGELTFARERNRALALAGEIRARTGGKLPTRLPLDFALGEFRLHGVVDGIFGDELISWRSIKEPKAKDRLRLWIMFLAVNAAPGAARLTSATVMAEKEVCTFSAPPDAAALLGELLTLYWEGLRSPLCFFPESSLEYAVRVFKQKAESAVDAALTEWEADAQGHKRPEQDDPWFRQCFGHTHPIETEAFANLASKIWLPLLKAEVEAEA